MGKGKLEKFADMREYPHVFEYPYSVADNVTFDMKGNWNRDFFKNDNPIVLELGCGRGEYLVLKGHKIDYFFSLSYLEKLFVYSAMIKEKESEQQQKITNNI